MTMNLYQEAARLYVRYVNHASPLQAEALLMDYLPADNLDGRVCDIPIEGISAFMDTLRELLDAPREAIWQPTGR